MREKNREDIFLRTVKKDNKKELSVKKALLGGRWDSNPRPSVPQTDALTN